MTPDDKRRLAAYRDFMDLDHGVTAPDVAFFLRLLDEALEGEDSLTRGFEAVERECRGIRRKLRGTEAQRDAAMAALREMHEALDHAEAVLSIVQPRSHTKEYLETLVQVRAAIAAYSAATKPTEVQE